MLSEGHDVSCLDEDPESHARLEIDLEKSWEDMGGQFTVGTALEIEALHDRRDRRAPTSSSPRPTATTRTSSSPRSPSGASSVPTVIARVLDPYRAEWYEEQGLHTICPTRVAIEMLEAEVRDGRARGTAALGRAPWTTRTPTPDADRMYIMIVGAGKVGWNLARELLEKGHEVTLIESDRERYLTVEQELEHNVQYGDASELWVLERAGITRADMVIAVTGDDEDNMLICQVAKEKYLVDRIIARVNNPRNRAALRAARGQAGGLRDRPDPAPDRARGARVRPRAPARPARAAARDHRDAARSTTRASPGAGSATSSMPEGSLLISVLREGTGFVPDADTVLEAGRRGARGARPDGRGAT